MKNSLLRSVVLAICLLFGLSGAYAQGSRITGTVTDANGPVVGATVLVKGTTRGLSTDVKGEFAIQASPSDVLVFSFVGYEDQEIAVGQRTRIDVVMQESTTVLDDVVVVGFGTQKRADLTTAISSVDVDDMKKTSATNVAEMLRGRVAGVTITNTGGRPGQSSSIEIRGVRSLAQGEVLYVIDGVVATKTEFETISPEEIASIDIAKDAAAQAIYGARASDGIVYITTKRGREGEYRISANTKVSWTSLPRNRNFDFYNAREWYDLRAEAMAADRQSKSTEIVTGKDIEPADVLSDNIMMDMYQSGRWTDWEDLMFKTSMSQEYDISVSGGTERMKVSAIAGYVNQDGMIRTNSGYKRGNLRMNMDIQPRKWITLKFGGSYMKSEQEFEDGNFTYFITRPPLGMAYDEEGNLRQFINSNYDQNPLWNEKNARDRRRSDYGNLNASLEITPFKGLTLGTTFSYRNVSTEDADYRTSQYPGGSAASGSIKDGKRNTYEMNNMITYVVPFRNEDHSLKVIGVHSYFRNDYSSLSFKANKVPVDDFWWDALADGVVIDKTREIKQNVLISYAARAEYSFKGRYMANAVVRRDGSSKFGKNNKWGTFPALSLAWRLSEEPFLKQIQMIDNLKLRVSYGVVGSESNIGEYEAKSTTTGYVYEFGDAYYQGYLPGARLANPNLKWERSASWNFGLDFNLFRHRLNGEINYYTTETNDLLYLREIPEALGYTEIRDNVAKTRSSGFELAMNGDVVRTNAVTWNIGMTFSTFRNKVLELSGAVDENGHPLDDIKNKWFIGHPINVYYNYKSDGIYQYSDFDVVNGKYVLRPTIDTDGDGVPDKAIERDDTVLPGKIKIIDRDGDGRITPEDRFIIPRSPKWNMSLNMSATWKGFDFYMDWYGVYGRKIENKYLNDGNLGGGLTGKLNGIKVNYWTPTNPSNEFPRPYYSSNTSHHDVLSIQDASYLRLRTLQLGYTFPSVVLNKLTMKDLRIYCTLSNVFTHSDFKSFNPESTLNGYPEGMQVLLGLSVTF